MPDQEKTSAPAAPLPAISIVPVAVPATTTAAQPDFKDAPPNTPRFAPVKHPVLFAVHGKKHLISSLKDLINADPNLQDPYKALLHHELSFVKTEAAEIDLHVIKLPNDDVHVQMHIKRHKLG
jgi:hypothetical protein